MKYKPNDPKEKSLISYPVIFISGQYIADVSDKVSKYFKLSEKKLFQIPVHIFALN